MLKLLLAVGLLAVGGVLLMTRERTDEPPGDRGAQREPATPREGDGRHGGGARRTRPRPRRPRLKPAVCPADGARCRSVTGQVVYVESVDPDGDGDLHVVIADEGISLPGLTAVDVKPALRPRRDPRFGDLATAAGPVQTGSYGQKQIHALRFAVQR